MSTKLDFIQNVFGILFFLNPLLFLDFDSKLGMLSYLILFHLFFELHWISFSINIVFFFFHNTLLCLLQATLDFIQHYLYSYILLIFFPPFFTNAGLHSTSGNFLFLKTLLSFLYQRWFQFSLLIYHSASIYSLAFNNACGFYSKLLFFFFPIILFFSPLLMPTCLCSQAHNHSFCILFRVFLPYT